MSNKSLFPDQSKMDSGTGSGISSSSGMEEQVEGNNDFNDMEREREREREREDDKGIERHDDAAAVYANDAHDGQSTRRNNVTAVKAGVTRQLPEGWKSKVDPSTGDIYYINKTTKQTQWDFPEEEYGDGDKESSSIAEIESDAVREREEERELRRQLKFLSGGGEEVGVGCMGETFSFDDAIKIMDVDDDDQNNNGGNYNRGGDNEIDINSDAKAGGGGVMEHHHSSSDAKKFGGLGYSIDSRVSVLLDSTSNSRRPTLETINNLDIDPFDVEKASLMASVARNEGDDKVSSSAFEFESPSGIPVSLSGDGISWTQSGVSISLSRDLMSRWSADIATKSRALGNDNAEVVSDCSIGASTSMIATSTSGPPSPSSSSAFIGNQVLYLEQMNPHERDNLLQYFDEHHRYVLAERPAERLISVTTFVKASFNQFDSKDKSEQLAIKAADKPDSKYRGKSAQEIRDEWESNGEDARNRGTNMHKDIEIYVNMHASSPSSLSSSLSPSSSQSGDKDMDFSSTNSCGIDIDSAVDVSVVVSSESSERNQSNVGPMTKLVPQSDSIEFKYFMNFLSTESSGILKGFEPYRTEWRIFDEEFLIAGSMDAVYRRRVDGIFTNECIILDWKRCKGKLKSNPGFPVSSNHNSVNKLPPGKFWEYALQLSTYKKILEKCYGYSVVGLYLVVMHPDNQNYYLERVPDEDEKGNKMSQQVEDLLKNSVESRRTKFCNCNVQCSIMTENLRKFYCCGNKSQVASSNSSADTVSCELKMPVLSPKCDCGVQASYFVTKDIKSLNFGRAFYKCGKRSPPKETISAAIDASSCVGGGGCGGKVEGGGGGEFSSPGAAKEGVRLCRCGVPARQGITQSNKNGNQGRAYSCCPNEVFGDASKPGCKFFEFKDAPKSPSSYRTPAMALSTPATTSTSTSISNNYSDQCKYFVWASEIPDI